MTSFCGMFHPIDPLQSGTAYGYITYPSGVDSVDLTKCVTPSKESQGNMTCNLKAVLSACPRINVPSDSSWMLGLSPGQYKCAAKACMRGPQGS